MEKHQQSSTPDFTRDEVVEDAMLAVIQLRGLTEYGGTPAPHLRRIERRLRELVELPPSFPSLKVAS